MGHILRQLEVVLTIRETYGILIMAVSGDSKKGKHYLPNDLAIAIQALIRSSTFFVESARS